MKLAFVTGAGGFVGSNLVRQLLEEGVAVRGLVRPGSDTSSLSGLDVDLRQGDIRTAAGLAALIRGCDACFHAAAAISSPDPGELYRTNAEGTRAVLAAAVEAGVSSIVHVSTMGTLSRSDGLPARETDRRVTANASDYVKSKLAGEEVARELAARGAPIVIVHPAAPVGPYDRVPTVTGRRIRDVLEGRMPRWIAGRINHVAVRDVARGMILASRRGERGRSYLLAREGGNLSREEFVSIVARVAGIPRPRRGLRSRLRSWLRPAPSSSGPGSLACDPSVSVRELGLPQTPLEDAFREAVEWIRHVP